MAFDKGREAVKEAIESSSQGFSGGSQWFKWSAGEEKTLRFLSEPDDQYVVRMHDQVPCHDGKKRGFICQSQIDDKDGNPLPCELCAENYKVKKRIYGIAVLREKVEDAKGQLQGYRDYTEEVEEEQNGKKVKKTVPFVGIVAQSPTNFWAVLDAYYDKRGTLLDRDYEILRRGGDKETIYHAFECPAVPIPEDDKGKPLAKDWRTYLHKRFENYMPDIEGMLKRMAAPEYFDRQIRGIKPDSDDQKPSEAAEKPSEASGNGQAETKVEEDDADKAEFERLRAEAREEAKAAYQ